MSYKVVFFGTPEFAVSSLTALLADPRFAVAAVFTQPDRPAGRGLKLQPSPVKVAALAANVPMYQPEKLGEAEIELLKSFTPDFFVVAAYGLLLSPAVLALPKIAPVNVHASLLPRWRGASPIQSAILAGDQMTGISYMRMEQGLDTGAVYTTAELSIGEHETTGGLTQRLAELGGHKLPEVLVGIAEGRLPPVPQDNLLATHAPKIKKESAEIHWDTESAEQILRKVRALNPAPGAWMLVEGKRLKIYDLRFKIYDLGDVEIGKIVVKDEMVLIRTMDNQVLELITVQPEGKRAMPAAEWLRGREE